MDSPAQQQSLWKMGVRKTIVKSKKANVITGLFTCSICDFRTTKPGPLAVHMKAKHASLNVASGRDRPIMSMFSPAALTERQRIPSRDVMTTFIIGGIIDAAVKEGKAPNVKKFDSRKKNGGAKRRMLRSWEFKRKVILDYSEHAPIRSRR